MMPAMYSAISGLQAHQTMLDVTANNLANVDTIGFKAQRTTFVNELSQLLSGGSGQTGANGGTNPQQIGLGVQVGSIDNIMSAGSLQNTGNTLDVAIQGDGFLCIGSGTPGATPTTGVPAIATLQYTRAGNLTTDSQGYLCTSQGQYVIGSQVENGAPSGVPDTYIQIPPGSTNVTIGQNGLVSYTDENSQDQTYGQTVDAGYIALASFPNEAGLMRGAGSTWSASANSGAAVYGTPDTGTFQNSQIISGELEQSNVDMSTEFTNMIEAERGYQANSSVISTADQMMQTLVQMSQAG
ncbi:MAG: flagellar hook-basal body complex protein [Solirubrobacteraceae bacterium]